jgi:HlyD family secretion protein/macrolide-specific efflux system membrane fusion protein
VAKAELAAARALEDTAHINLDYATLRAPISGVVSSITTQEGETVAASLNAPTFINIVDLGRLQVDDYVDETDIGLIKVGQEAFFTVDAYPGRGFRGKVEAVHPSALLIDNVVYYTVVIRITESYRDLLKPEMTASISIVVDKKDKAVWVPSQAVRLREGRQTVFVQRDGRVEPQDVEVGWSEAGRSEIVSGLAPGQKVLVPGSRQNAGPPRR